MKHPYNILKAILPALLCLFGFYQKAYSQWVPVSQAFADNVALYVSPSAINGTLLDTTNISVTSLQSYTITSSVTDITGIQYFDNLQNLAVNPTLISTPPLPAGLKTLSLNSAGSSISGPFPSGLTSLTIKGGTFNPLPSIPGTLTKLYITNCTALTSIPALPNGLQRLEIMAMPATYTNFPAIPSTVTYVDFSSTKYGPIPDLPPNLTTFNCAVCPNITSIPTLPFTLKELNLRNCSLTGYAYMPLALDILNISGNPLTSIPALPDTIRISLNMDNMASLTNISDLANIYIGQGISMNNCPNANVQAFLPFIRNTDNTTSNTLSIYASNCNISTVPQFNARLYALNLSNNPISSLPNQHLFTSGSQSWFPMHTLNSLNVSNCNLTTINPYFFTQTQVVGYMSDLYASNNQLTHVGYVPAAHTLDLSNNQITVCDTSLFTNNIDLRNNNISCIPYIRVGVSKLLITGNPVNCLPNVPDTNFVCDIGTTVCQAGNSNGCAVLNVVGGRIFNDADTDGVKDTTEQWLAGHAVLMEPDGVIQAGDSNGVYRLNCELGKTYTVKGQPGHPYRYVTTASYSVNYGMFGIIDTAHNIGIHTLPNVNDLIVKITPYVEARPGFMHRYKINVINEGSTVQNGNLVFYFDSALVYQSASAPGTIAGNSISWPINNMQPLQEYNVQIYFAIPATVNLGDTLSASAYAIGNANDTTAYDNHDTIQQIAIGSYDPNDKQVYPAEGMTIQEISSGMYYNYLIRFQNTGTASAINVRLEDTLSQLLNINTFEILDASHDYTWKIEGRLLTIYFSNINLIDAGTNEVESHGFFRFRIKPVANISVGQTIGNTAHIYFDFNTAIVTNTAVTTISDLFIQQPQPQILCYGEKLLLIAKTSNAVKQKMWYQNNVPLNITTDTIYIDSATTANAGQYKCEATLHNGAKYFSHQVGVQVYDAPTNPAEFYIWASGSIFHNHSIVRCADYNTPTTIPFGVRGFAQGTTGTCKWYLNDSLIRTSLEGNGNSFIITRVWDANDKLSCRLISNQCSETVVADSVFVTIKTTADTFAVNISPELPIICPGQTITFSATGSRPTYDWYLNDVYYAGSKSSITLSNLNSGDKVRARASLPSGIGCPYISVFNGRDLTADTAFVTVSTAVGQPQAIDTMQLVNAPLCSGSTNKIVVKGSNFGAMPHYQWFVNGNAVGLDTNILYSVLQTGDVVSCNVIRNMCVTDTITSSLPPLSVAGTLPVASILLADTGTCSVSTSAKATITNTAVPGVSYTWKLNGTVQSTFQSFSAQRPARPGNDTITLDINTHNACGDSIFRDTLILPGITKYNVNYTINALPSYNVCRSQQITFRSNAPTHRWHKNGVFVSNSSNYTTSDTSNFVIFDVYSGTICANADTTPPVYINVLNSPVLPTVQISLSPQAACEIGEAISFSVSTNVYTPYVSWRRNDNGFSNVAPTNWQQGDKITARIQVIGSCVSTPSATFFYDSLIINTANQYPTVQISNSAPLTCPIGNNNTFTASGFYLGSFPSYEWIKNGVQVGLNTASYTDMQVQAGDLIYCKVQSNNPCVVNADAVSDTIVIGNGTTYTPSITITESANNVCDGTSIAISSQVSNQGNTPTYQWTVNGDTIPNTGSNLPAGQYQDGDIVTCTLASSDVCASPSTAASNQVTLWVTESVNPTVSASANDSTICAGTTVSFTLANQYEGSAPTYTFKINGNAVSTSPNFSSSTLQNGDVLTVEMTTDEQCATASTVTSSPISFIVYNAPTKPAISQNGNVLTSSYVGGNTWYYSGNPISAANADTYNATQPGWYNVLATDSHGCSSMSDSVYVQLVSIGTVNTEDLLTIYPNPASSYVNVYVSSNMLGAELGMTDAMGKLIFTGIMHNKLISINTEQFAKGVYTISLYHAVGGIKQSKLVLK